MGKIKRFIKSFCICSKSTTVPLRVSPRVPVVFGVGRLLVLHYEGLCQRMDEKPILQIASNKAKGRISKQVFQENKAHQIFQKMNISYPVICTHMCAYQGVRNVHLFRKFDVLCFLETPVLRFVLLPYYQ